VLKRITCLTALAVSLVFNASADSLTRSYPPPFEAFQTIAQQTDAGWQIDVQVLPGYYLYVKDFQPSIVQASDSRSLQWTLPELDRVQDPLRGDIEVMRDRFVTAIETPTDGELWLALQGCADSGFCYPPEKRLLAIISE